MIKTASYSRLIDFETCRFKAYLKHVAYVPDPKPNTASLRGTAIHETIETWMRGNGPASPEAMKHFDKELNALQRRHQEGLVSLEGKWGFNQQWEPTEYKKAWLKMKADAIVTLAPTKAIVIDYKTGKRFGNELKHGEQCQLYAIATFIRNPKLEEIITELWYFDQNELASYPMTRKAATYAMKSFDKRLKRMTSATDFPPNPNAFSCKYCPYKSNDLGGTGHCKTGV